MSLFCLLYTRPARIPTPIMRNPLQRADYLFVQPASGSLRLSLEMPDHVAGQRQLALLGRSAADAVDRGRVIGGRIRRKRLPALSNARSTWCCRGSIAGVALVTIANGGDNNGIYIPAFAIRSGSEIGVIAMVFAALTALWCMLAHWMVNHRRFGAPLRRHGHLFAPLILTGLGVLILHHAGTIGWLLHPANY